MASRPRSFIFASFASFGSLAMGLLAPARAHACGGTFCDGQQPMPVDQTGEDILFVRDGLEFEAHVRIQYTGEVDRFAWLVPLPAVPEVSIGSELLFVALAREAIPVWSTSLDYEDPEDAPWDGCPPGGCLDLAGGNDPEVVLEETVGAFEVVVLDADSVDQVLEFFQQNDYAYLPEASPIIQSYLDQGLLIAAVKLTTNAEVDEIHPLVFRFVSDEPCVPIRLTAVAARDDLGIRAYFLGENRWAPSNYAHVVLNPLLYDWAATSWGDYVELLSLAVDEAEGGRGFVTEYADEHGIWTGSVWQQSWKSDEIANANAHEALDALSGMGLLFPLHPQVRAALREYLPPPPDWMDPEEFFWEGHDLHPELINAIPFGAAESAGLAAMLDERLFMPSEHAADLLDTWPYLTRLHTTLSPEEMIVDPTFHQVPDLSTIDEDRRALGLVLAGAQWTRYRIPYEELPGYERPVEWMCVENDEDWPAPELPSARRIEQVPMMGPPQVLVDNAEAISAWAQAQYMGSTCEALDPDGGDSDGESGGASESESGSGNDLGLAPMSGSQSSCACTTDTRRGGALGGLFLFALLAVRRRR